MFGIGGFELFIIVVFIFVIFGPDKLPEIIKITGMGIKKFRKAKSEMDKVLQEEIVDPVMKVANEPDPPKKSEEKKPAESKEKSSDNKPAESKAKTSAKTSVKKTEAKKPVAKKNPPKKKGGK